MFRLALFALSLLAATAHAQDPDALLRDTRRNALPVLPKVVGMMTETVAARGLVEAIPVCSEKAPLLLQAQARETGWAMRRVSLKTRNPGRGRPDVWEARHLADFDIRAANGEKVESLEAGEVVTANGKSFYRYIRAIPVGEVCLNCHGPAAQLDAALQRQLAASYPHDEATGYAKGQIRGALSVWRPLGE